MRALTQGWKVLPPPALQLARIAVALGLKAAPETKPKPTEAENAESLEALMRVLPMRKGLPANDPTLDWIKNL